jgi:putative component of toxin-antitoxin plasmid stabilization module
MKYKLYRTKTFDKEFEKLPSFEQKEIQNFENKLIENPFVGKPLGLIFFREKKLNGRRVYYLIYEEFVVILMVAISDKKTQQPTIEAIKNRLNEYYNLVKNSLDKI